MRLLDVYSVAALRRSPVHILHKHHAEAQHRASSRGHEGLQTHRWRLQRWTHHPSHPAILHLACQVCDRYTRNAVSTKRNFAVALVCWVICLITLGLRSRGNVLQLRKERFETNLSPLRYFFESLSWVWYNILIQISSFNSRMSKIPILRV